MNIEREIKNLKKEIEMFKNYQHNAGMKGAAREFQKERNENKTKYELLFESIAVKKHLNLESQYKIYIWNKAKTKILRFYFVDFCDLKNKLVFEVDGPYHYDKKQHIKDLKRSRDLHRLGYKVFRITNEDVYQGKTTSFLTNAYLSIGIDISNYDK